MTDPTPEVIAIVTKVLKAFHLFRDEPTILPESSLAEIQVDALDRMGISLRVEDRWGFIVSDKEEREWTHVSDIVEMVRQRAGVSA